jgi:hypothetical protein
MEDLAALFMLLPLEINCPQQLGTPDQISDVAARRGSGTPLLAETSATNSANHGLLVAGLVFSSCVRDSTKPAIRDRSSSMDGMSISSAT